MCMEAKYEAVKVSGVLLGLFQRTIRSVVFNILMFLLGFAAGFIYIATQVHVTYNRNANHECVETLEQHLKQQRILDQKIDRELFALKLKLSHDQCHFCDKPLFNKVIR